MDRPTAQELAEAAAEARREYHAKWQREHPEKVKEYKARYWQKKGAEILANRKATKGL